MRTLADGSGPAPDDVAAPGAERRDGHVPADGGSRLSDAAIAISATSAARVADAVPLARPDDQTTWILARRADLPHAEETRVIGALTWLGSDARKRSGAGGGA